MKRQKCAIRHLTHRPGQSRRVGGVCCMVARYRLKGLELGRCGRPLCVNPQAPWIRYPVFWNVWQFGGAMLVVGLFCMISDLHIIG